MILMSWFLTLRLNYKYFMLRLNVYEQPTLTRLNNLSFATMSNNNDVPR